MVPASANGQEMKSHRESMTSMVPKGIAAKLLQPTKSKTRKLLEHDESNRRRKKENILIGDCNKVEHESDGDDWNRHNG